MAFESGHRHCQHVRTRRANAGFTLIEILASMTILIFLVLMLTRVYTEGSNAWRTGSRNATRNMLARSVMDFMAKELSMAAFEFGNNPSKNFVSMAYYANTTKGNFGLEGADEIAFARLNDPAEYMSGPDDLQDTNKLKRARSARLISYYVERLGAVNGRPAITNAPENADYRFALWREDRKPDPNSQDYGMYFSSAGLYWMGQSPAQHLPHERSTGTILIDDVRTFEVFAYTDKNGGSVADWQSFGNQKLAFLDIYLETFDPRDAEQAALLAASLGPTHKTTVEFVERAVKRNYRRVYLYNKSGWQDNW